MRRNWISRSLVSVFALWLAVCMVEPVQLHTCAMHGGLAIGPTSVADAQAHTSASLHMAMHPAASHSQQNQHSDNESHQCSCLGDCNNGRAPIGLAVVAVSLLAPVLSEGSTSGFGYNSPALVAPHFLLPFSNGPPAGSSRA